MPMTIKQAMNLKEMTPEEREELYFQCLEETARKIRKEEYERRTQRASDV